MTEHKEKLKHQKEMISDLQKMVTDLKADKSSLIEEIERKERIMHELKNKLPGECTFGCNKYDKSIDEIVTAGNKHREKVLALKELAEEQKDKIRSLRNQKSHLESQVDKLESDLDMEKNFVSTIQRDSARKINKLKDDLKATEDLKRMHEKEKSKYESSLKTNDELENHVKKQKLELCTNENTIKEMSNKIEFLKPKLESSLKEIQSLTASLNVEKEKSSINLKMVEKLEEKLVGFWDVVQERDKFALKVRDLEDEILQKQKDVGVIRMSRSTAFSSFFKI